MNKKKNESINDIAISEAIDLMIGKGVDLSTMLSSRGLLKQLTKRLVEKALESEMDSHLGHPVIPPFIVSKIVEFSINDKEGDSTV